MKKSLGISIYPELAGELNTIKYIDLAKKYGFTKIFTNLLEIKNNNKGIKKLRMLSRIYKYAKDKGFEIIADVNPYFYKEFGLDKTEINFFYNLNISGIRLDEDFQGKVESILTNNDKGLLIELNASSTIKIIDLTLENGGRADRLIACHNFYPMRFTGLSENRFFELSSHFKSRGIRVKAFITLPENENMTGPWNINEGMPTLERHRDMDIDDQVKELLSFGLVDDILISQQGATETQFKIINQAIKEVEYLKKSEMVLNIKVENNIGKTEFDILFNNKGKSHQNRADFNDFFVRSTYPRIEYKDFNIKQNKSGKKLTPGDVVILNENLGRYKGELHIVTQELNDYNNSRNLVGQIIKEDMWKLKFIKGNIKFKIKEVKCQI